MKGSHCRLFDENLVRTIMINACISIIDYLKAHNKEINAEEVCEYVEYNADDIIEETLKNLNRENASREEGESSAPQPPDADTLEEDGDEQTW